MKIQIALSLLIFGCKNAEDIRREKIVDNLNETVKQSEKGLGQTQKMLADLTNRINILERMLNKSNGKLEEIEHKQSNLLAANRIEIDKLHEKVASHEKGLEANKNYLKRVISNLKQLERGLKGEKASPISLFKKANNFFKSGRLQDALSIFEEIEYEKMPYNIKAQTIHHIGVIKMRNGKLQEALTYFSKVFSEYPKSPFAANALLNLGVIFKKLDQNDKAYKSWELLVSKYPKSSRVSKAKEYLKERD